MSNWREHKARMKQNVHRTLRFQAVYLVRANATPVPCFVRVHSKVTPNQNEFSWPSSPGYLEIDPYVIFDGAEIPAPARNALVVLGPAEIYRLGPAEPQREGFVKVDANRIEVAECAEIITSIPNATTDPAFLGVLF